MLRKVKLGKIKFAGLGLVYFAALLHLQNAVAQNPFANENGFANGCLAYDQVTAQLEKKYSEQRLFSGFAYRGDSKSVGAIYEFWTNPEHGNWSLIARKLVMFQYQGRQVTRDCGFVTSSGQGYNLVTGGADGGAAAVIEEPGRASSPGVTAPLDASCIPHSRLAYALLERYEEKPVLQALTKDSALVEIYTSKNSWTITRAQLQGVKISPAGTPLHDVKTGHEIRQICSTAVFSGQSWGFFDLIEDHI